MTIRKESAAKQIRAILVDYLRDNGKTSFAALQAHLNKSTDYSHGSIIGALRTAADLEPKIIKIKEGSSAFYDLRDNYKTSLNDDTSNVLSLDSFEKDVINLLTDFNDIKMQLLKGLEVNDYAYWKELKLKLEDIEGVVLNHKNQKKDNE